MNPQLQTEYRYYAFISYSRKDQRWARWLQHQLENYRLPTRILQKYENVPKRVTPIFRDETDLAGVVLQDSLKDALAESRYLIVISSPNSAQSEWVGKEIEAFRAMGREDHIIPFIVDGVPFSEEAALECFHAQLRTVRPVLMGVSAVELGRRKAFLRLIATMFRLQYDELLARDSKRRLRKRILTTALSIFLMAGIFAGLWYNTEHTAYFRNYITRYEVPEGIGRLNEQEREGAYASYRFTTLRGKVVRVELVDAYDNVTNSLIRVANSDYPRLDYFYDSNGELIRIAQYNVTGEIASEKALTHDGDRIAIDYRTPGDSLMSQSIASDQSYDILSSISSDRSEIVRQINTYDENGRLIKVMYYRDSLGTPACDANGIYGKLYEYNEAGLISAACNLNAQGELRVCKYGWAIVRYEYDARNRVISEAFFDAEGAAAYNRNGVWAERYTYDECDNITNVIQYDTEGQRTVDGYGVCEFVKTYDEHGKIVNQKYLGIDGQSTSDRYGLHESRYILNEQGLCIETAFFDVNGSPVNYGEENCARIEYEYDTYGRVILERYYDSENNPCCHGATGVYITGLSYDEYGFVNSQKGYDMNMNSMSFRYGYSEIRIENKTDGKWTRLEYLDEEGNLTRGSGNYAVDVRTYDQYGNLIGVRYYDENGFPCCTIDGYHGIDWHYEEGLLICESYIAEDGSTACCKDYYHAILYSYDEHGNRISEKYLDTYGEMIENTNWYAERCCRFDEYGRLVEEVYYDRFGNLFKHDEYYRHLYTYAKSGNVSRMDSFYYNYELSAERHVVSLAETDVYGNIICTTNYNGEDQLKELPEGVLKIINTYDQQSRIIRRDEVYPSAGYTESVQYIYDAHGYLIEEIYTTTDATGVETTLYAYRYGRDRMGNCCRAEYLGSDGALDDSEYGCSVILRQFTPEGYCSSEAFYNASGEPVTVSGYFRTEMKHDAMGNIIEQRYYGADGNLLRVGEEHSAIAVMEYDSCGNVIYKALFDENGEPCYDSYLEGACASRYYYAYGNDILYWEALADDGSVILRQYTLARIKEVYAGSYAESLGIQPLDIILEYGDWCYFDEYNPYIPFKAEIRRLDHSGKKMLLCRMTETGCDIIPVEASMPDTLGISISGYLFMQSEVDTMHAVWQQYRKTMDS